MSPSSNTKIYHFLEISLLITHYNRSSSLHRLLLSLEKLNCTFSEIIVSDDGSEKEHLDSLLKASEKYVCRLVLAEKNKGLGNNINKGQDAVTIRYTLYIQEDFVPTVDFPVNLKLALNTIIHVECIDIVRFYTYTLYPYLEYFEKGFSKMYLLFSGLTFRKLYQYSDHPHLRKSSFLTKFGRYNEGVEGDKTEYNMCFSFIKNIGCGMFFNDFTSLFTQENSESKPGTMKRGRLIESENIFIKVLRDLYRQIKSNYHIHLKKIS